MARCSKDVKTGLTDLQARFVVCYANSLDLNAKQAAIDAGADPKNASVTASKWLKMANVRAELAKVQGELAKDTRITKEWWLKRQADIADLDLADLYDSAGFLKPLTDIPVNVRRCMKRIKAAELFDGGTGDQRSVIGIIKEIETLDPQKALSDIGKHMGWLKERVEHSGKVSLEQLVAGETDRG